MLWLLSLRLRAPNGHKTITQKRPLTQRGSARRKEHGAGFTKNLFILQYVSARRLHATCYWDLCVVFRLKGLRCVNVQWHTTRLQRNRVMHAQNGNAVPDQQCVSLQSFNPNDVNVLGRWDRICNFTDDIVVLSETHATLRTQSTLKHSNNDYHVVWGHAQPSSSRTGIAIMVKKSSCWAAAPLEFESGACKRYLQEGRLVSVQIFVEGGKRSIIFVASLTRKMLSIVCCVIYHPNWRGEAAYPSLSPLTNPRS